MDAIDVLYDWYLQKWQRDEEIASPARAALNYIGSDALRKPISKSEFVRWLRMPSSNPRVKQMWINGFVYGHESEVTGLPKSIQLYLDDCVAHSPDFLDTPGTGLRNAS